MKPGFPMILLLAALLLSACESEARSGLNKVPELVFQKLPEFPFELHQAGVEGSATVDFVVNTHGDVTRAYAIEATHPEFGRAAVAAVYQWKFRPGIRNGIPTAAHMQIPVYFHLEAAKSPQGQPEINH